jgi:peptidoglycan/LPS O-acetylase OafA/YrhL
VVSTEQRGNNFDLLRLCAAVLVVLHHCFSVAGIREPLTSINAGDSLGVLGVLFFFSISGYLVTQSWSRTRQLVPFAVKRALRLLPALVVCVTLVALVLGTVVSALPARTYLGSHETYQYILENSLLHTIYALPGVFAHVPDAHVVNASLWTIPIEAHAYVAVALLGVIGLWRRSWVWLLLAGALIVVSAATVAGHPILHPLLSLVGGAGDDARFLAAFCIGAALFLLHDRVALRWDLFLVALAAYLLSLLTSPALHQTVTIVTVPYLTLVLAYRTAAIVTLYAGVGDLSYGIYLYAFPIQQVLSQYITHNPWVIFAMALPISASLAFVSWRVIEAPALRLKPRGSERRRGPVQAALPTLPHELQPAVWAAPVTQANSGVSGTTEA